MIKFAPTQANVERLLWLKDNFMPTIDVALDALEAQPDDDLGKNISRFLYNYAITVDSYLRPLADKAAEYRDVTVARPPHVVVPVFPGVSISC